MVTEALSHEQVAANPTPEVLPAVRSDDQRGADLQVLPTLAECEQVIEQAQPTFRAVGLALTAIRDGRLYLETHATFERYCRDRWHMSRPRAYQLIAAAAMSTTVDNERQARRLRAVTAEEEPSIESQDSPFWDRLVDAMEVIELLSSSDASSLAAAVPHRRRAATAKRLRKLGTFLGRIAWSLESEGTPE